MKSDEEQILDFLHQSEKLKTVMRHSWLSDGRQEDVAEHTWRMALMAILLHSYLDQKVNLLKVLKIILVHDLVEINYKDSPAFKKQPLDKAAKERASLIKLTRSLPENLRKELLELWEEYEAGQTAESKFAKAMDKTEVLLQHNEAGLKFLTKPEYAFNLVHGKQWCAHDAFLTKFRDSIDTETLKLYKKNKVKKELYSLD